MDLAKKKARIAGFACPYSNLAQNAPLSKLASNAHFYWH